MSPSMLKIVWLACTLVAEFVCMMLRVFKLLPGKLFGVAVAWPVSLTSFWNTIELLYFLLLGLLEFL